MFPYEGMTAPTPTKQPRAVTPFRTVADATKDVSLVDWLDLDDLKLESIDTTFASVAASALNEGNSTSVLHPQSPPPSYK